MSGVSESQQKRSAVIQLFLNGKKQNQILRTLGSPKYSRSFISRTIKRYIETGKITDIQRSGRPRTVRTPANKKKIRQILIRRPTTSTRKVAAKVGIDRESARRIIKKDLGIKCFKRTRVESLNAKTMSKRIQRCRKLLAWLKNVNSDSIVQARFALACAARLANTSRPPEAPFGRLESHWLIIREIHL